MNLSSRDADIVDFRCPYVERDRRSSTRLTGCDLLCQLAWAVGAQIKHYFWVCMWGCFWTSFDSVDLVKKITLLNVGGHRLIHGGPRQNRRWEEGRIASFLFPWVILLVLSLWRILNSYFPCNPSPSNSLHSSEQHRQLIFPCGFLWKGMNWSILHGAGT